MSPQAALANEVFRFYVSLVAGFLVVAGAVLAALRWGVGQGVQHAWQSYCGAFFGVFLLLLVGLLSSGAEETKREPCKANLDLVGPCRPMRGRIGFANGAYWAKIWQVGTKRILGIHRDIPLPQNLQDALGGRWDVVVFGDFVVCPFTKEVPGHMQSVCVESTAHLRVKKQDALSRNP